MKHTIHGFNQQKATELELSNDDLLVLRWFVDYKETGKMQRTYIENINNMGYWVNYTKIIEDLPILFKDKVDKPTTLDSKFKRVNRIVNGNLSKVLKRDCKRKGEGKGTKVFLSVVPEIYGLLVNDNYHQTKMSTGNNDHQTKMSSVTPDKFVQSNISINNNKESKKEAQSYNEIINSYTENLEVREAICEFIKMRKLIKSPPTNKALKIMLSKLDKLSSNNDYKRIAILEQSIENSWKGIFPLKEDGTSVKPKEADERYIEC